MSPFVLALVLVAGLSCSSATANRLGSQTSIEEYPYIVQVENRVFLAWLQQCAGSVLTSYHLLTAASCFADDFSNFAQNRRIRAGTSLRGLGGVVREVSQVYRYPTYGQLENEADIAVVKLEGYWNLGSTIQQTPILGEGIYLPAGLMVTLVGWGSTAEGNPISNADLFALDLFTVYYDTCLEKYFGTAIITENMVCTGLQSTNGRDLDLRDIGSPVLYANVAVGVVSFGKTNGNDTYPVVSTSVSSYSNWIVGVAA